MNNALNILMNSYGGGTGNVMAYYNMDSFDIINGSGIVKNVSPSSTVGFNDAFLDSGKDTGILHDKGYSGCNLSYSKLTINSFNNSFLSNSDLNWSASFLFSFTKTDSEDGILFGCLNKDQIDYYGVSGIYGRGFNIGVNDRNQLFLQGIDFENGPYVIVADELELANKNLCSVSFDPYNVTFGYYDLTSDRTYQQTKLTNNLIENISGDEKFYIGGSNFYYKNPGFSGYIDEFMIISGDYDMNTLKSIISGFVSYEILNTESTGFVTVVTGQEITTIQETGITGYQLVQTGSRPVFTTGYYYETIITTGFSTVQDGLRTITGFTLPNGLSYNEEVGLIYETDEYRSSGNMANATLGLVDQLLTSITGGVNLAYSVKQTGSIPLYGLSPLTGFIGITGATTAPLTTQVSIDGSTGYSFSFISGIMEEYRHNYLYYLSKRLW